jgi:hypothetical protein
VENGKSENHWSFAVLHVFLCAWKGTPSGPGPSFAPWTFLNGFDHHAATAPCAAVYRRR